MAPERWRQVSEIFHAAIEHDQASRETFLEDACRHDPTLRAEVDVLVAAHAAAGSFGEAPVGMTPLAAGTRLGFYDIGELIGAGGMGEVYRARDTRLGRDVAIKVLPLHLTNEPDRRSRFEREARILATLNDPHIAQIYGFEESDDVCALVMELVPGKTLEEALNDGPRMGLSAVASVARQIAEALEAAHEKGIVHRDLKPANIKLTSDGAVKVLDFGLARVLEAASDGRPPDQPAITVDDTRPGAILGTAAYMSPEQARGKAVDTRADIWAFGCVVYEMLSGRRAFEGETFSDTVAAVLDREPLWDTLPSTVPAAMRRLLRRCLEKDPRQRLHDIADARLALEDALETPDQPALSQRPSRNRFVWVAGTIAGLLVGAAVALAVVRRGNASTTPGEVFQFNIAPPQDATIGGVAVSADGKQIAFTATSKGVSKIWLQPFASLTATPLAGTEQGGQPFWSPDNRFIGFFAAGKLKKIATSGGAPVTICDAPTGRGGTWNSQGEIVFAPGTDSGLQRVSADGGEPVWVTKLDESRHDTTHRNPSFLPDGRHFVYSSGGGASLGVLAVSSLDSTDVVLLPDGFKPAFATGYLLFGRETTSGGVYSLMQQRFNVSTLRFEGDPVQLITDGVSSFSASATGGVLAYVAAKNQASQLHWIDRSGQAISSVGDPNPFEVALSPDEHRVATTFSPSGPALGDLFLLDLNRGVPTKFTFNPANDFFPVWSPDGKRIVFSSTRSGRYKLYEKTTNFVGDEKEVQFSSDVTPPDIVATDWSQDGRFLLCTFAGGPTGSHIWVIPLTGDRKAFPFRQTKANEGHAHFSKDGHWVAYSSDESNRSEIYIAPLPETGVGPRRISTEGGTQPMWSRDGKELFFLAPDGSMMVVDDLQSGTPRKLFSTSVDFTGFGNQYAVTEHGTRFLVNVFPRSLVPITVVVNWPKLVSER
jgi:serine/threonine protein kinase/Tol biopolymer transport system component